MVDDWRSRGDYDSNLLVESSVRCCASKETLSGIGGVELVPRNTYCFMRHKQVQSPPKIPASISLHMTVAAERACFMITLGSGGRVPCNTSSKRSALSNASKTAPARCVLLRIHLFIRATRARYFTGISVLPETTTS